MFFVNEINKIKKENLNKKIAIFVDMDGVIADYRYGEGEKIRKNIKNIYLNKRSIKSTINIFFLLSKTNNLYILSSCMFDEQIKEKNKWLDINAPFFKNDKRIFVIAKENKERKDLKISKVKELIDNKVIDLCVMVDDTHDILFVAKEILKDKLIPFHVITVLD
jgi:hypothetical protein